MEIFLKQIIIFFAENYLVTIPLLVIFSTALALLAWKQTKNGYRFFFSKRRLIEQLREKKTLN